MPGEGEENETLILCGDCGMAALVPFKPLESRKAFCPRCYRRRKDEERRYGVASTPSGRRSPDH